ncbi:hypothetical protein D3C85_250850 [compost metagenome]
MVPILDNKKSLVPIFYNSIEVKIEKRIRKILGNGRIKKNKTVVNLSPLLRNYLNSLIYNNNTSLKSIIIASPGRLNLLVRWMKIFNPQFLDKDNEDSIILYNIFVEHGYDIIDKFSFVNNLKIDTCVYCNRNYIFSISKKKVVKAEIDHFYPKSIYPLLALSYYNLIPSCESCNGLGAKGSKDPYFEGLKNPYLINYDDFKFTFKIKNISIINPICGKSDIEVEFKDKIQSHCDVFNLDDLYSLHHDHAIELVIKQRLKYSKKYRSYLNSYDGLTFNKSEIDRMILGNYSLESEQHKRPLSKLYQDIGKELGLI